MENGATKARMLWVITVGATFAAALVVVLNTPGTAAYSAYPAGFGFAAAGDCSTSPTASSSPSETASSSPTTSPTGSPSQMAATASPSGSTSPSGSPSDGGGNPVDQVLAQVTAQPSDSGSPTGSPTGSTSPTGSSSPSGSGLSELFGSPTPTPTPTPSPSCSPSSSKKDTDLSINFEQKKAMFKGHATSQSHACESGRLIKLKKAKKGQDKKVDATSTNRKGKYMFDERKLHRGRYYSKTGKMTTTNKKGQSVTCTKAKSKMVHAH